MNPFKILSLPVSLTNGEESIKSAYEKSPQSAQDLEARNQLLSNAQTLEAWMKLKNIPLTKHSSLPAQILPLFSRMAETIAKVNELSEKQSAAKSLLTQTLITKDLLNEKSALDGLNEDISKVENEILSNFTGLEESESPSEANLSLQSLKFIKKWKMSLNSAYGKLF